MGDSISLPDRLKRSMETSGEVVRYAFANGLSIKTEIFNKKDPQRILPLGSPQCGLMNHIANFPERVRGRRVFEPFAGSGPLGSMAMKQGARSVDFLDVNPRACEFQTENAHANGFDLDRIRCIEGDIHTFVPDEPYDLLLANPPFVPLPAAMPGTLTSNGGPEGNRFVSVLFERLEELLAPAGEALIYVFQFARNGEPLGLELARRLVEHRLVEWIPAQQHPIRLSTWIEVHHQLFPDQRDAIEAWQAELVAAHGEGLTLTHFVVCIGPRTREPTICRIQPDFAQRFGADFLVPSEDERALAMGRAFENFVPR